MRLYKDWFLFVDDLSVATGRKKCHGDGPSGAHDVSCCLRAETEEEKARKGKGMGAGKSNRSPFAHSFYVAWIYRLLLLSILSAPYPAHPRPNPFISALSPLIFFHVLF